MSTPGSPSAIRDGCTCDPHINNNGAGAGRSVGGTPLYVPAKRCPLHGEPRKTRKRGAA